MTVTMERLDFAGGQGAKLSARLDKPAGRVRAFALFAHCFTCSKDINAARQIAGELARLGIAVLRFDFTGLGSSEGEFASTGFSSNVEDLVAAADCLRDRHEAPSLLIGHSLGGAAVLAAAGEIPEVKAVATVGAPADVAHVLGNFSAHLEEIEEKGSAEVTLVGRKFNIGRQFVEDARSAALLDRVAGMHKALLVLHAPTDQVVGIENAGDIFTAAKHPKSFVSLDGADHLITDKRDALFAARTIAAWAERYLPEDEAPEAAYAGDYAVLVRETHNGQFQNTVHAGHHRLLADEPESVGGLDSGPGPYDYLAAALGACTSMTLRMYAGRKKLDVGTVSVEIDHEKLHADDCRDCVDEVKAAGGKIDVFRRRISVEGDMDEPLRAKLLEIADKCPVHRTLESRAHIETEMVDDKGGFR